MSSGVGTGARGLSVEGSISGRLSDQELFFLIFFGRARACARVRARAPRRSAKKKKDKEEEEVQNSFKFCSKRKT